VAGTKLLSLSFELADLGAAVEGARLLLERLQEPSGSRTPEEVQTLGSGLALLGVVGARLELLRRAIRREVDPALLLTGENLVAESRGEDLVLLPWSANETRKYCQEELQRLEVLERRRGRR
jgi:hypothetical protein